MADSPEITNIPIAPTEYPEVIYFEDEVEAELQVEDWMISEKTWKI
jgi:hypothetical protein